MISKTLRISLWQLQQGTGQRCRFGNIHAERCFVTRLIGPTFNSLEKQMLYLARANDCVYRRSPSDSLDENAETRRDTRRLNHDRTSDGTLWRSSIMMQRDRWHKPDKCGDNIELRSM